MLRGLDPTLAATGPFLQQLNPLLRYLEFNQTKLSDFLAIGPARSAASARRCRARKSNGHVLPQIIMTGARVAAGADAHDRPTAATPTSGPTPARDPETMILPSFDCNTPGEKAPTNTPGCSVQGAGAVRGHEPALPARAARRSPAAA